MSLWCVRAAFFLRSKLKLMRIDGHGENIIKNRTDFYRNTHWFVCLYFALFHGYTDHRSLIFIDEFASIYVLNCFSSPIQNLNIIHEYVTHCFPFHTMRKQNCAVACNLRPIKKKRNK